MKPFGPKYQLIHRHPSPFISAHIGSVGSGKSTFTLVEYAGFVRRAPKGVRHVMVGHTQDAIFDNVGAQLQAIYGEKHVKFRRSSGAAIILFGITIRVYGANNKLSHKKLQGGNVYSAYVDEVVNIPEEMLVELRNRLRIPATDTHPGSRMWVTGNPGPKRHWFLKNWLEKATLKVDMDGQVHRYADTPEDPRIRLHWYCTNMEDNRENLPDWYIEEARKTLTGHRLRRDYYGEWVDAEGLIYDMWDEDEHVISADLLPIMDSMLAIGMDHGSTKGEDGVGNTRGILLGIGPHPYDQGLALYAVDEWAPGAVADIYQSKSLRQWIAGMPDRPRRIYLDPAAESMHLQLADDRVRGVEDADNSVAPGIKMVASLLASGRLFISDACGLLIAEFAEYVWDEKAQARGEDKPNKAAGNDHSLDALRYAVYSTHHRWRRYFDTLALADETAA